MTLPSFIGSEAAPTFVPARSIVSGNSSERTLALWPVAGGVKCGQPRSQSSVSVECVSPASPAGADGVWVSPEHGL
jgi:hypothetical protein